MPRALKYLLIACCLTLASVAVGVLLADSARAEPAGAQPGRPGVRQPVVGAGDQPTERGREQVTRVRVRSTGSQVLI